VYDFAGIHDQSQQSVNAEQSETIFMSGDGENVSSIVGVPFKEKMASRTIARFQEPIHLSLKKAALLRCAIRYSFSHIMVSVALSVRKRSIPQ